MSRILPDARPVPGPAPPPVGARYPDGWRACADPAWMAAWRPQPFDLGDGATEVVTMGQGPSLLLIPPLPGFKEAFLALAPRLAERFRVTTFDLRARFPGAASWEVLLQDLERVAAAFAPGPAVVVGHSLGGALAQHWALARPERVSALVLSSSFARVRTPARHVWKRYVEQPLVLGSQRWLPPGLARRLARSFAARSAWVYDPQCDERVRELVRLGIRGLPVADAMRCVRLALAHDTRGRLAALRAPTLLIVGERETAFARVSTDELSRLVPVAELRVAPGVSHLHPLSAPEWLARTITEWALPRATA